MSACQPSSKAQMVRLKKAASKQRNPGNPCRKTWTSPSACGIQHSTHSICTPDSPFPPPLLTLSMTRKRHLVSNGIQHMAYSPLQHTVLYGIQCSMACSTLRIQSAHQTAPKSILTSSRTRKRAREARAWGARMPSRRHTASLAGVDTTRSGDPARAALCA